MYDQDVLERVTIGAACLDEDFPKWFEWIDPTVLDMEEGDRCIVGQVGARKADKEIYDQYFRSHGFDGWSSDEYEMLEEAWLEQVNARLMAAEITDTNIGKRKRRVTADPLRTPVPAPQRVPQRPATTPPRKEPVKV